MIKKLFSICVLALLFCFASCSGSSVVNENNDIFSNAVKSVTADKVTLSELATFEWDTMYNFIPFTPKEIIEEIIGFSSNDIRTTYNEGHTQLIFVKDNKIVCNIWGYAANLGYFISFGRYDGGYIAIQNDETASFTIDNSSGELLLTYIPEITDFSTARPNPYDEKIKKYGYSITIHYTPEDVERMMQNAVDKIKSLDMLELDLDEIAALAKYRKANSL